MYEGNAYTKRLYSVLSDWLQYENAEVSIEREAFAQVGSALQFHKNMKIPVKSVMGVTWFIIWVYKINPCLINPYNHNRVILCHFPSIAFHLQVSGALDTVKQCWQLDMLPLSAWETEVQRSYQTTQLQYQKQSSILVNYNISSQSFYELDCKTLLLVIPAV